MAQFVFNLEGVLRQRKMVEQQRQRALAEVEVLYGQAEAELWALDASVQQVSADVKQNRLVGRLDLGYLAGHRRYVAAMQRKAMAIAQRMTEIKLKVDEARSALSRAARDRKSVEKLREKQSEAWKQDQARREAAELDEVSMRLSFENLRGSVVHGDAGLLE